VLTTVVSRPTPERAVVDAGKKGLHPSFGMSVAFDTAGVELTSLHSEHGILQLSEEARNLKVGDQIRFIPYYLEGTINLYDRAYAIRNGQAVEEWQISGRGRSQ
jgi:D-serine deaminase-like pyridoxal phosphate-dependent protein